MKYKLIFVLIVVVILINHKRKEEFSSTKTLFLYKENMTDPNLNQINLARVEVIDVNDNKVPLKIHSSSSSIDIPDLKLENMLDGKNETYGSLAFLRKHKSHKWTNETYKDSVCKPLVQEKPNKNCLKNELKPRWISFTFTPEADIKEIYIRNAPNLKIKPKSEYASDAEYYKAKGEAGVLRKKIKGLKVLIYNGVINQKDLITTKPLFYKQIESTSLDHKIDIKISTSSKSTSKSTSSKSTSLLIYVGIGIGLLIPIVLLSR